jgi:16S rRNA (uracil1498-N3)-methyltransferase
VRVPRFFVEALAASVVLGAEESHHATNVLRLSPGAEVELFDGKGAAARYRIGAKGREGLVLVDATPVEESREPRVAVTLAFAPARPKRTLALVEKATELGVARFVPLETRRTRVGIPEKGVAKLRRRAVEACKQCGRNVVPTFAESTTLEALVEREAADLRLLPDTKGARPLREALRARSGAASALFAIGPEGGFEDGERTLLRAAGFEPVILGRSILRVETAALAVLACLVYELG